MNEIRDFISAHGLNIFFGVMILLQWVVLQGLIVHYLMFRRNLKKPRPDGIRFANIEKVQAFHAQQLEMAFAKMGELKKEIVRSLPSQDERPEPRGMNLPDTASYVSLGEIELKKRLRELKSDSDRVN